mgnify:CR=1 FL=1
MNKRCNIYWIDSMVANCWVCEKKGKCIAHDRSIKHGFICRTCFDSAVWIDQELSKYYESPEPGTGFDRSGWEGWGSHE